MSIVHVVAEGGVLPHDTSDGAACWCLPRIEQAGDGLVIHHVVHDERLEPVPEADATEDGSEDAEE